MTKILGGVAVVTGGASGIGRGIAEQLIAEGATVVIADVDQAALETTAEEIGATGVCADVRVPADLGHLAARVLERHGRVDVVALNAGVGPAGRIADLTLDDWRWMLDVNLFGVVHGIRAFLPLLERNADGGHLLVTSSMAALTPVPGLGAYTAAKSAVAGLVEVLDLELRQQRSAVHATVLLPGGVRTRIAESLRHRDPVTATGLHDVDAEAGPAADQRWIEPIDAGRVATRAIRTDTLHAITHPDLWPQVAERQELRRAAFHRHPVLVPDPEPTGRAPTAAPTPAGSPV